MPRIVVAPTDAAGWRAATRALVLAGVPPEEIVWAADGPADPLPEAGGSFAVSRTLVELAETAIAGGEPRARELFYRLVWRAHGGDRGLAASMEDAEMLEGRRLAGAALRAAALAAPDPLAAARARAAACHVCPLHQPATRTVFGEGPADAPIMLIGEQPGDQEDLAGRPFVGPAGQVLDRALAEAGLDRARLYVTNAVKHFKFTPQGPRRLHQKPEGGEIEACRFWLDIERGAIRPRLTVLLGATAARSVLGRTVTIGRERSRPIALGEGGTGLVTVHPSFLLRLPDEAARAREYRAFVDDLALAARLAG